MATAEAAVPEPLVVAVSSGAAPVEAEAQLPPGYERVRIPGEARWFRPGASRTQVIIGRNHVMLVTQPQPGSFFVGFPGVELPERDAGTGKELEKGWVGVSRDQVLEITRDSGVSRPVVQTDVQTRIIKIRLPDRATSTLQGGEVDFTDIISSPGTEAELMLSGSGAIQIDNLDSVYGIAVPLAQAAREGSPASETEASETLRPKFDVGIATDVGRERTHNEDMVIVSSDTQFGSAGGREQGIYGVFDGMGGHRAGELASGLAARTATKEYQSGRQANETPADFAKRIVAAANKRVYDERGVRNTDMGTTGIIAIQEGNHVVVAHAGDSRAYVIDGNGTVRFKTTDHSLVQRLVETGQISEEEARTHEQRNVVYRTLGDKPRVEVDVSEIVLGPNEHLILCSDGLHGVVEDEGLTRIITEAPSAQAASEALIAAANAAGGPDNISAIVVRSKAQQEGKLLQSAPRERLEQLTPIQLITRYFELDRGLDPLRKKGGIQRETFAGLSGAETEQVFTTLHRALQVLAAMGSQGFKRIKLPSGSTIDLAAIRTKLGQDIIDLGKQVQS